MRIMYVEDNAVNLGLVTRIAKMGNHDVINYANGEDALKALETEQVDLILMDIELEGELSGIDVVKKLRERGDKRPIIAVTAYAMVGDKERILEAGCDGYLPKPLPVAQFLNILAKYDPANASDSTTITNEFTKRQTDTIKKMGQAKESATKPPSAAPVTESSTDTSQASKADPKPETSTKPSPNNPEAVDKLKDVVGSKDASAKDKASSETTTDTKATPDTSTESDRSPTASEAVDKLKDVVGSKDTNKDKQAKSSDTDTSDKPKEAVDGDAIKADDTNPVAVVGSADELADTVRMKSVTDLPPLPKSEDKKADTEPKSAEQKETTSADSSSQASTPSATNTTNNGETASNKDVSSASAEKTKDNGV